MKKMRSARKADFDPLEYLANSNVCKTCGATLSLFQAEAHRFPSPQGYAMERARFVYMPVNAKEHSCGDCVGGHTIRIGWMVVRNGKFVDYKAE